VILSTQKILEGALMLIGVLDPEATTQEPASTYQTALEVFNDMIGSWNLENLLVYTVNATTFPFVPGQQRYQLGSTNPFTCNVLGNTLTVLQGQPSMQNGATLTVPGLPSGTTIVGLITGNEYQISYTAPAPLTQVQGGVNLGTNWNYPRPTRVDRVSVQFPGSSGLVVELPVPVVDVEHWQSVTVKGVQTGVVPTLCYNDTNFPYMDLSFWPIPSQPCSAVLYTWDQLQEAASLTDLVQVPQGYNEALKYNLAVRLAPLFERDPAPSVVQMAIRSKANINDINNGVPVMSLDACYGHGKSWSIGLRSRGFMVP
jgi:hypothetical protein